MANGIVLNIDTTKSEFQNPMVQLRQGDGNYQSLAVTVTSNGEPFDLTGWTITFMGTTAGGFKIVDSAVTVTNALQGEFTYTPTKAWGQDQGEYKNAYFKFVKSDKTASSAEFRVNVLDAVDLTAEEANDYISVVDALIDNVKTSMETKLSETKQTLSDTQTQANTVQANVNDLNTSVNDLKTQNLNIKTSDNTWTGKNTFNLPIVGNVDGTATTANDPQAIHINDFGVINDFKQPIGVTFIDKLNNEFLQHSVNVKWFGAVGDGVTDDTEAIQDVIDKYDNVYIPSGTYSIRTLSIDKKTFVHGAGQGITILKSKDESDHQMINLKLSASRSMISNLTLKGADSWDNKYGSKLGLVLSSDGTPVDQDTEIVIKNVTINFFFDNFTLMEGHRGVVCDQMSCGGAGHKNIVVMGTDNSFINCTSAMSMNDGIYVIGANNRLTSCKSFMAGMSKTAGAGARIQGSYINMVNCEFQENYLCNLYLYNCISSNIIGIILDGAGAHNDTGSLYYKDTEFNNASVPICNLRTHNCKSDNISATIINGKTVNGNSWISAIGCYTFYPALDKNNNINLTSNNLDPTSTDTYKTVDLPSYYWLNNSLTINGSNTINDVNYELSHGFNVYSYTLNSGLTITNNKDLNGSLAVSSNEYQMSIDYPKNSKQLSVGFDYDYDKTLGNQLFGVFDILIACKDSSGTTQYYTSSYKYLTDLMFTIYISDILTNVNYSEIISVTGRFRFKNTSASTTNVAVKNLKMLIVTGIL